LIAKTKFGCSDTISTTVTVVSKPTAGFTFTNECIGVANKFTNTSKDVNSMTTYKWLLEPNVTSTVTSPNYIYPNDGKYNVCLIADNGLNSCRDTICQDVYVYPKPKVDFGLSKYTNCGSDTFTFFNKTAIKSGSYTLRWDFGDNFGSTALKPVHKYDNPGFIEFCCNQN
jgi:PKD repeat protein